MGYLIFCLAHIPLFYFVYVNLTSRENTLTFITGFDLFMIIHVGLHLLLLKHERNEFKDWISWLLIVGAGLCGAMDLLV
ncbi:DUF6713 family protein [Spirosoma soli]|uniref:DUF6713 family protein n=1 Tax=Spirosoma soli TaxID=1770529 RepID=A0ABW5LYY0_9BACT